MQYYAKIGEFYYRLFSIREGHGQESHNDYMKWSTSTDPIGRHKFTKEFTLHPSKIAIKHAPGKNRGSAYETLYNFGFRNPKRQLVQLWVNNVSEGFARQKSESILFPDDPFRPYWISAYFTTLPQAEIEAIFAAEKLDRIMYYSGAFGNLVTLLKFVQPEWELLGVDPPGQMSHWDHPTFQLKQKYEL